jgi:hypothetical protein
VTLTREGSTLLSQLADLYADLAKQLFPFTSDLELIAGRRQVAFILERRANLDRHPSGQMVVFSLWLLAPSYASKSAPISTYFTH